MSLLFNIIGLRHPGRVDLFQFGTVDLCTADDKLLTKIYLADPKIRFLQPTQEGLKQLYPDSIMEVKPRKIENHDDHKIESDNMDNNSINQSTQSVPAFVEGQSSESITKPVVKKNRSSKKKK